MAAKKSEKKIAGIDINENLMLMQIPIEGSDAKPLPEEINHVFMADMSGSMYGFRDRLVKDMKERIRDLRKGDVVTLGWFSSPGEYRFVIKGFRLDGEPKSYQKLDAALDEFRIMGSTCFSEILTDAAQVVKELTPLASTFALTFLTDGYPTVWPMEKEIKAINEALEQLKGKVAASLFVGYGSYYNKELLSSMAETIGGELIHSANLSAFSETYGLFLKQKSRSSKPMVTVDLPENPHGKMGGVFGVDGDNIRCYKAEGKKVSVFPSDDRLYVIVDKATGAKCEKMPPKETERALYAAALFFMQRQRTDVALDALGKLKDKLILNSAVNAFTNDEYGAVEQMIGQAVGNEQKRFVGGKTKPGFVPPRDAFCVLDLLDMLVDDEEAQFTPKSDDFEYERIGPPSETKPGYPSYEAEDDVRVPFDDLVMHSTLMNLSIRTTIPVKVNMPDEIRVVEEGGKTLLTTSTAKDTKVLKRPKEIPAKWKAHIYRTYTIVKNGFLNLPKLPVVLSRSSYETCVTEGLLPKEKGPYKKGQLYTLDLRKIPVMNRAMADDYTKANDLVKHVAIEAEQEGIVKGLRHLLEEVSPRSLRRVEEPLLSTEGKNFLKYVGINHDGSFGPPVLPPKSTDYYMAGSLEFAVKGMSSLPSVNEVRQKIESGKERTISQRAVEMGLEIGTPFSEKKDVTSLQGLVRSHTAKLRSARRQMQRAKFAVLLGKRWFDEFTSRIGCSLPIEVNGRETVVNFKLGEEKIDF